MPDLKKFELNFLISRSGIPTAKRMSEKGNAVTMQSLDLGRWYQLLSKFPYNKG